MVSIEIIGNLGANVEKVSTNGNTFYSFNVCDNKKVNGQEISQWYGCTLNKPSEKLLPYLQKGQTVFVRGVPRYRIFDSAKHHCKMVAVDVFVNEIQLVGSAPSNDGDTNDQSDTDEPEVY
ncbi:single-stranded DNA-binding protein [Ralstonia pseudosolanacearum]|uniref:single-stranded DNA-binding protein n=1 Tax=Ralstonia pseudosolanacearum TaxID=1310165 RepID=UPI003D16D9A6|nr:single-stranded DNA-binding protein [Alistipes sp.]MBR2116012.1 single-stranded DNA-binding protein [Alistipes sp.]